MLMKYRLIIILFLVWGLVHIPIFAAQTDHNIAMTHDTAQKIKIDIWSDVVCPFCYLGKHRLEEAIKKTWKRR